MAEVIARRGVVQVVLDDSCGEGIEGGYRSDDPVDIPLMRFDVQKRVDGSWQTLDDASYCTQIDARLPAGELKRLARLLLGEVYEPARDHGDVKKLCERLSWINKTWGTKAEDRGWVLDG